MTLKELQETMPWVANYHPDFVASQMTHKNFGHALLHAQKACGKLAAVINDAEHQGSNFNPEEVDRFIADLVVCALRMASTIPGRHLDLEAEVVARIKRNNDVAVNKEKQ